MGIKNILPVFAPALEERHIGEFAGQSVAIDISGWMYSTMECHPLKYVKRQVEIIRKFNVKPILVFDGAAPEAKAEVIAERERKRKLKLEEATQLERDGKTSEAHTVRQNALRRSEPIKARVIRWCRRNRVSYVEAPYEADAQIAYLMKTGKVQLALTEDSDFLKFGCERILFKYSNGFAYYYDHVRFPDCWEAEYDMEAYRAICVLRDYLMGGLNGFGIVRAYKLYQQLGGEFQYNKMVKLIDVPIKEAFQEAFNRAVNTFQYQLVWDQETSQVVPLTEYPPGKSHTDYPFAGVLHEAHGSHWNPPVQEELTAQPPPKLTCRACKDVFDSPIALRVHMQERHLLQCSTCQRTFKYRRYLDSHERSHQEILLCTFCHDKFASEESLHEHIKVHADQQSFVCETCSSLFSSKVSLDNHVPCHSSQEKFICTLCSKPFQRKFELNLHLLYHSTRAKRTFPCVYCREIFKNSKDLEKHVASHDLEYRYLCGICNDRFKENSELSLHVMEHFAENLVACEHCGLRLEGEEALQQHMRDHLDNEPKENENETLSSKKKEEKDKPLPFSCNVCQKSFGKKASLYAHQQTHRTDTWVTCEICGKQLKMKCSLAKHKKKHSGIRPFKCSMCDKSFLDKFQLQQHEKIHSSKLPFVCTKCGRGFRRRDHLNGHMKSHSDAKSFACSFCQKSFRYADDLKKHSKRHNPANEVTCEVCSEKFFSQAILNRHMEMHDDNLRLVCKICSKEFNTRALLRVHRKTHMPVRPFSCATCGQGFYERGHLTTHMMRHTTIRPFGCEKCSSSFINQRGLKRHMNTVHATERKFVCEICGKGFTTKYSLDVHAGKHAEEPLFFCEKCNEGFFFKSCLNKHKKVCK